MMGGRLHLLDANPRSEVESYANHRLAPTRQTFTLSVSSEFEMLDHSQPLCHEFENLRLDSRCKEVASSIQEFEPKALLLFKDQVPCKAPPLSATFNRSDVEAEIGLHLVANFNILYYFEYQLLLPLNCERS